MRNTLNHLLAKTPGARIAREARAAAEAAAESRAESQRQLADSQRRAAEARARIVADHDNLFEELVALAFQFGRMQGHAEAAQDRLAEMTAQARTDTP